MSAPVGQLQEIDQRRRTSPWTTREKLGRLAWAVVQSTLFKWSPHNFYGYRAALLRLFGAKLHGDVRIRRTVRVEVPWNLEAGDNTAVGDFAIIYNLGPIKLGKYVTISQYAHLCAGTHETTDRLMRLLRPPITIGDDVWIATDAFVGPNVTIGDRAILGARSSAFTDLPAGMVCVGSPAKPIKPREFHADGAAG
jgi:putative colanic acid biosynthesis acetyltransferase WcaF